MAADDMDWNEAMTLIDRIAADDRSLASAKTRYCQYTKQTIVHASAGCAKTQ